MKCEAITEHGRCKREATSGKYCWQHAPKQLKKTSQKKSSYKKRSYSARRRSPSRQASARRSSSVTTISHNRSFIKKKTTHQPYVHRRRHGSVGRITRYGSFRSIMPTKDPKQSSLSSEFNFPQPPAVKEKSVSSPFNFPPPPSSSSVKQQSPWEKVPPSIMNVFRCMKNNDKFTVVPIKLTDYSKNTYEVCQNQNNCKEVDKNIVVYTTSSDTTTGLQIQIQLFESAVTAGIAPKMESSSFICLDDDKYRQFTLVQKLYGLSLKQLPSLQTERSSMSSVLSLYWKLLNIGISVVFLPEDVIYDKKTSRFYLVHFQDATELKTENKMETMITKTVYFFGLLLDTGNWSQLSDLALNEKADKWITVFDNIVDWFKNQFGGNVEQQLYDKVANIFKNNITILKQKVAAFARWDSKFQMPKLEPIS